MTVCAINGPQCHCNFSPSQNGHSESLGSLDDVRMYSTKLEVDHQVEKELVGKITRGFSGQFQYWLLPATSKVQVKPQKSQKKIKLKEIQEKPQKSPPVTKEIQLILHSPQYKPGEELRRRSN